MLLTSRRREHIRRKHLKPFICITPGCPVRVSDKNQIYRHRIRKHREEPTRLIHSQTQDQLAFRQNEVLKRRGISYAQMVAVCAATTVAELEALDSHRPLAKHPPAEHRPAKHRPAETQPIDVEPAHLSELALVDNFVSASLVPLLACLTLAEQEARLQACAERLVAEVTRHLWPQAPPQVFYPEAYQAEMLRTPALTRTKPSLTDRSTSFGSFRRTEFAPAGLVGFEGPSVSNEGWHQSKAASNEGWQQQGAGDGDEGCYFRSENHNAAASEERWYQSNPLEPAVVNNNAWHQWPDWP